MHIYGIWLVETFTNNSGGAGGRAAGTALCYSMTA